MVQGYTESRITEIFENGETSRIFRIKYKSKTFPGQYLMVWSKGLGEESIPITFSDQDFVEITLNNKTAPSKKLLGLTKKDTILIRGPYGHGFPMNNIKQKDIVLVGDNSLFSPLSFIQRFVKENKKDYGKITTIILQGDNDDFIEKTRRLKENDDSEVYVVKHLDDVKNILEEQNKNAEYLLSFENNSLEAILDFFKKKGVSLKQIYFYLHRKISCATGICGTCQTFSVHVCIDGPVFRADRITRFFK